MTKCMNDFKILKNANEVQKIQYLSMSQDIICGGCDKKLSEFCNFINYDVYKWKHLWRRIIDSRRMQLGLD
jgi:predicted Fe-S protein YdhL (DUF1289 family)